MLHVNKKTTSEKWTFISNKKLGIERTEWIGKTLLKNPIQKIEETVKIELPNVKTTSKKAISCLNTVFSLYFEIRAKKIHAAKPLAFSLHFLFRRDQNHYSNLTSKIMKMCEQILKKHSRTCPEKQFNKINEKLRSTLPDQQINWIMTAKTQTK